MIGGPTTPSQDGGRFLHQGPIPQTALGQRGLAPWRQLQSRLARVDGSVDLRQRERHRPVNWSKVGAASHIAQDSAS